VSRIFRAWLAGALLAGLSAEAGAQAITSPSCRPGWWDDAVVRDATAVELEAAGAGDVEVLFTVDPPCERSAIVSVLVRRGPAFATRSVDVGDVPASARARAVAMGVGALAATLAGEPVEVTADPGDPAAAAATVTTRESAPSPERPAGGAGGERGSRDRSPEVAPRATPAPGPSATRLLDRVPSSAPTRVAVEVAAVGALTRGPSGWGGVAAAARLERGRLRARLGLDAAFTRASDPLGEVRGRWVATSLGVGVGGRQGVWSLGAMAALVVDWIRLAGHGAWAAVLTQTRARWRVSAGVSGRVARAFADRFEVFLALGLRVHPWGLAAQSPTGTVLAIERVSGLVRLGVAVTLGS